MEPYTYQRGPINVIQDEIGRKLKELSERFGIPFAELDARRYPRPLDDPKSVVLVICGSGPQHLEMEKFLAEVAPEAVRGRFGQERQKTKVPGEPATDVLEFFDFYSMYDALKKVVERAPSVRSQIGAGRT